MANCKLTPAVIDVLISELQIAIDSGVESLPIRSICKKAGISHTTFYRWLRAYRLLKGRRGRLTESEKLLRNLGCAFDAYIQASTAARKAKCLSRHMGSRLMGRLKRLESYENRRYKAIEASLGVSPSPREDPKLSALEKRTDELVGDRGKVAVFDLAQFSLKNK